MNCVELDILRQKIQYEIIPGAEEERQLKIKARKKWNWGSANRIEEVMRGEDQIRLGYIEKSDAKFICAVMKDAKARYIGKMQLRSDIPYRLVVIARKDGLDWLFVELTEEASV